MKNKTTGKEIKKGINSGQYQKSIEANVEIPYDIIFSNYKPKQKETNWDSVIWCICCAWLGYFIGCIGTMLIIG